MLSTITTFRLQEIVGSQGGVITNWLSSRPEARATFRIRIKWLRQIKREAWSQNEFRNLGKGIWEIKWKTANVQFRALGFDHARHFVLVIGCAHKQRVYDPHNCVDTARIRKAEVENGERTTINFEP